MAFNNVLGLDSSEYSKNNVQLITKLHVKHKTSSLHVSPTDAEHAL